jgi:DNA-binding MarR family transcriptional regulator
MSDANETEGGGHIARGLIRLMMAVDDAYTQASRELRLTAQQAQLLCAVQRPAAVGDIAQFLRCDRSNVSHLVDRVSRRGLIQREVTTTDGRLRLVGLSPDGQQLVQQFTQIVGSRFETVFADWPEERLQDALATLHALAEALESAEREQT